MKFGRRCNQYPRQIFEIFEIIPGTPRDDKIVNFLGVPCRDMHFANALVASLVTKLQSF